MLSPPIGSSESGWSKVNAGMVPRKEQRVRRSREQWRELLERFEHSGQSREQFCREQGLTLSSFAHWRRELGKAGARRRAVASAPFFLEVSPHASGAPGNWDVELELGAGMVLRLRRAC
jgi:hypothetical protein